MKNLIITLLIIFFTSSCENKQRFHMLNYGGSILENGKNGKKFVFNVNKLENDFVIEHYIDGNLSAVIAKVEKGKLEDVIISFDETSNYLTVFDFPKTKKIKLYPDGVDKGNFGHGGTTRQIFYESLTKDVCFFEKDFDYTSTETKKKVNVSHKFKAKIIK